jgi:transcriptional regulator of nitric oxide reductase
MVRYARAKRDLAAVELARARQMGEALPQFTIARLRSNLNVAEEQLQQTTLASTGGPEMVRLRHAEEQVRLAGMELAAWQQLRDQGKIKELDLERLKLRLEVAQAKVDLMKTPGTFVTLMDSMERRLDQFGEEILVLEQRLAKLEAGIR